jgi:hypothetical protein
VAGKWFKLEGHASHAAADIGSGGSSFRNEDITPTKTVSLSRVNRSPGLSGELDHPEEQRYLGRILGPKVGISEEILAGSLLV